MKKSLMALIITSILISTVPVTAQPTALDYAMSFAPQAPVNTYGNKEISYAQLKTLVDTGDTFYFLNVSAETAYRLHHIPGSTHISFTEIPRQAIARFAKPYDVIIVYSAGATCRARTVAACMLRAFNYPYVFEYAGGSFEWQQFNQPAPPERYRSVSVARGKDQVVRSVNIQ